MGNDYGNEHGRTEGEAWKNKVSRFLDDHIRLVSAVSTIAVLLIAAIIAEWALNGNPFDAFRDKDTGKALSVSYLNGLSEKNAALSWRDFSGYTYETMSESEYDDTGTYVMRSYAVEGGRLSVTVAGFIDGSAYTGYVEYATVYSTDDFDFEFSLLGDDDFLAYLESYGQSTP